jgi:hypothetical protein
MPGSGGNADSDAANVLADQASTFSGRLVDYAYAIPKGTPTAMAALRAVARRIALFAIASAAVTSRKIGGVFIRSELRRSSEVSRRAGSEEHYEQVSDCQGQHRVAEHAREQSDQARARWHLKSVHGVSG